MVASPSPNPPKRYAAPALTALLVVAPAALFAGEADGPFQTNCYTRGASPAYYFNFGSRFGGEGA